MTFITDIFLHIISCVWWATCLQPHAQRIYEEPCVSTWSCKLRRVNWPNCEWPEKTCYISYGQSRTAGVHKCVFAPSLLNRSNLQRRCQLTQNEEIFLSASASRPELEKSDTSWPSPNCRWWFMAQHQPVV